MERFAKHKHYIPDYFPNSIADLTEKIRFLTSNLFSQPEIKLRVENIKGKL